ncbi:MAG TPA: carbohydrate ABC transporter permease [Acidimicrobiales bacterium]|nr:carbohydrate ABC transporter permease [Acidimicrobiales bacterium]
MTAPALRTGDVLPATLAATPGRRDPLATRSAKLVAFHAVMVAMGCVFLAPYVLTLFAAFKPVQQIFSQAPWDPPTSLYLHNFSYDLSATQMFGRYLLNTFGVTAALTTGQVFFGILAAYAFARLSFPGRDKIFWMFLITLMVPNAVTVVPLYSIMNEAHLLNTYWAIFLPYVFGSPYTIFLMRQFFRNIPQALIDAARVDGASEGRVLFRIVVPLSKPVIITATLIAIVFSWNNFLWPLIVTNSQTHYVLTIGLALFQTTMAAQWNYELAGSVITLAPLALLFMFFQRHLIRSVTLARPR